MTIGDFEVNDTPLLPVGRTKNIRNNNKTAGCDKCGWSWMTAEWQPNVEKHDHKPNGIRNANKLKKTPQKDKRPRIKAEWNHSPRGQKHNADVVSLHEGSPLAAAVIYI